MPFIVMHGFAKRSPERAQEMVEAAADTLSGVFGVGRVVTALYQDHCQDAFVLPEGKEPNRIVMEITCFPGRSEEQKKSFAERLEQRLTALGEDATDILYLFRELPKSNWKYPHK